MKTVQLSNETFQQWQSSLLGLTETAKQIGMSRAAARKYMSKGVLGIVYEAKTPQMSVSQYFVCKEAVHAFQDYLLGLESNFSTVNQLVEEYNYTSTLWFNAIKNHCPEGICCSIHDRVIRVPKLFVQTIISTVIVAEGFISQEEIMQILGVSRNTVNSLREEGLLGETVRGINAEGRTISANSKETVLLYKQQCEEEEQFLLQNGYISAEQAVELFPEKVSVQYVRKLLTAREFDNIYKLQYIVNRKKNYVKRESVLRFISENSLRYVSSEEPLDLFQEAISHIHIPPYLKKTAEVYVDYVQLFISESEASEKNLFYKTRSFVNHFQWLMQTLQKELFLHTDAELERLFKEMDSTKWHKLHLMSFLNRLKTTMDCTFNNRYTYTAQNLTPNRGDEFVYDFPTVLNYYKYVKDVEKHISIAISDRKYAVAWLYVGIHIVNAWRHGDVIKLPSIHLKEIGIDTLDYFKNNRLTMEQAVRILNQVEKSKIVDLLVGKTGFKRNFHVNKSFAIPLATVYAIAELHRQKEKDSIVINFGTKYNVPYKAAWKNFFRHQMDLYPFSSMKMNRSLIEHFYYNIKDKKGTSYIAYDLSRSLRNHKFNPLDLDKYFGEATQIYIRHMDEDIPFDLSALELFDRGEFGWLYALLLRGAKAMDGSELTIQSETTLIKEFKDRYSPKEVEKMAKFLQERNNQRATLAQEVLAMPTEKINDILEKLYFGEMPSREKYIQCISYPDCHRPLSDSCKDCNCGIPRAAIMQSLKDEIDCKLASLENETNWANAIRDKSVLDLLMDRVGEAMADLGKGYIKGFFDLKQLQLREKNVLQRLHTLHRLYLEEGIANGSPTS